MSVSTANDAKDRIGVAVPAEGLRRGDGIQALRTYRHIASIFCPHMGAATRTESSLILDGRKEKSSLDRHVPACVIDVALRLASR